MAAVRTALAVLSVLVVLVGASAAAPTASATPPAYTVVDLGTFGGDSAEAFEVNRNGQVAGAAFNANDVAWHAFSWTQTGGMVDLGAFGNSNWSAPAAINSNGEIVGSSNTAASGADVQRLPPYHAFSWTASPGPGLVDLGTLPGDQDSQAEAVNDNGLIAGISSDASGHQHAFLWTPGSGMQALPGLGGSSGGAWGINANGDVVGDSLLSDDNTEHAVLWPHAGGVVDLGALAGGTFSVARRINDADQIAGYGNASDLSTHALFWNSARTLVDIGVFAGGSFSAPEAMNANGEVVGGSNTADRSIQDPFAWTQSGGLVDLGSLGGPQGDAIAVNGSGLVVGSSQIASGDTHAFGWTPTSGGIFDLGTLGGTYAQANGLNDSGTIVGESTRTGDLVQAATLWQPSSDPNTTDSDGDGITDAVDTAPSTSSSSFDDHGGTTGTITSNPAGLTVSVADASAPADGVSISVGQGTGQITLTVCSGYAVALDAGTSTTLTCGSVRLGVTTGRAQVILGGGVTVVTISSSTTGYVNSNSDGSYVVEELAGSTPVTVTESGVTTTVVVGANLNVQTWRFVGFSQPVDNNLVLNVAKAGRVIPLKWRLLDAGSNPVTSLTKATITTQSVVCSTGLTTDDIEQYAAGSSGLQNLGNGYYQLNWATPSSYAGSCKTMLLDIGDGVSHKALFQFTK